MKSFLKSNLGFAFLHFMQYIWTLEILQNKMITLNYWSKAANIYSGLKITLTAMRKERKESSLVIVLTMFTYHDEGSFLITWSYYALNMKANFFIVMWSLKYCLRSEQRDMNLVTEKEDVNMLIQTSNCRTSCTYNVFYPRTSKHFRPTLQLNVFTSLTGQAKHKRKTVE